MCRNLKPGFTETKCFCVLRSNHVGAQPRLNPHVAPQYIPRLRIDPHRAGGIHLRASLSWEDRVFITNKTYLSLWWVSRFAVKQFFNVFSVWKPTFSFEVGTLPVKQHQFCLLKGRSLHNCPAFCCRKKQLVAGYAGPLTHYIRVNWQQVIHIIRVLLK